jgi:predicted MPP superfamily phosphohydrolase
MSAGPAADFGPLAARLGHALLRRRLHKQADLRANLAHQGEGPLVVERFLPLDRVLGVALRLAGLAARGRANFLDVRVVENDVRLPGLPEEFEGFRLLQVTDLHFDLDHALVGVIEPLLARTPHDLAVVTGDYADHEAGHFEECLDGIQRMARCLAPGSLAILGNHDLLEIVPHLEAAGLRVLLNENARHERGRGRIWFAGIDDPHFYRTHDLAAARRGIAPGETSVLLSHSPCTYREAEQAGFAFMLSGHTHGGQICLPGGFALVRNGRCPPHIAAGPWTHGRLRGYTSRGTGACGVAARFNCPPEITVHVLRRAETSAA